VQEGLSTYPRTFEALEGAVQFVVEVFADLVDHLGPGGGREAGDGGWRELELSSHLADEAADVQVFRAKVVSPFGEAVRLVDYPGRYPQERQATVRGTTKEIQGSFRRTSGLLSDNWNWASTTISRRSIPC